jgi:hypothetical protein
MRVRFLLDENLSHAIIEAVHQFDSDVDITAVGSPDAPPIATPDPNILLYCERERRLLITNNRRSMPGHIADHLAAGRHHWGVFRTHTRSPAIGPLAEMIYVYWGASEAEEHIDTQGWIP